MNLQRLDKIISLSLGVSRSEARKIIRYGKTQVDGKVIREPSFTLDPSGCEITHRGKRIEYKEHIYLIMNKPSGVLSASEDKARQTVVDLVPDSLKRRSLSPVGRLDRDTTGLLLLTDDGDFAHSVIHPKKNIYKTYLVSLDGEVTDGMSESFKNGVVLADGTKCKSAVPKRVSTNTAEIKISEGRYHQIKRMFGTENLGVNALKRTAIGGLLLPDNLAVGECRELSNDEIKRIFNN